MGRSGPAPTPTNILKLRGSWRGELNRNEPRPKAARPKCPKWIDSYAKQAWRQLVPQLESLGVLTLLDKHALVVLCQTWARWKKAEEFIQQHGETYPVRDDKGDVRYMKRFPEVATAEACARTLNRYFAEFGLTPSARSRITVTEPSSSDPKSRFLNVG